MTAVVVVTTSYPRHADDSAGCFVRHAVTAHLRAGRLVEVFAAGDPTPFDRDECRAHAGNLQITRVPFARAVPLFYGAGAPECFEAQPGRASIAAVGYWAALITALRARFTAAALPLPALVESHWLVPSSLAVAAVGYRGAHRAHAHSGDVALLERLPWGDALARWLLRARITPVFASADLRARLARRVREPAAAALVRAADVAPSTSPLLAALQGAPRGALARDGRPPVVLAVGRLVPIKGHDRLLRAVGGLPEERRPAVVILGAGPEEETLRKRAHALGVKLDLRGEVPAEDVRAWLGRAHLFVHAARRLPSGREEGMPVALREAHAAGLPIVAVASGGVGELAAWSGAWLHLLPDGNDTAVVGELRAAIAAALGGSSPTRAAPALGLK